MPWIYDSDRDEDREVEVVAFVSAADPTTGAGRSVEIAAVYFLDRPAPGLNSPCANVVKSLTERQRRRLERAVLEQADEIEADAHERRHDHRHAWDGRDGILS